MKKVFTPLLLLAFLCKSATAQNACEVTSTTPADVCAGQTATLSATGKAGNQIRWYDQQTGGILLQDSSNTLTVNNPTTSGVYYAEAFGGIAVADSLSTGLNATNSNTGIFWDVKALNTITLTDITFRPASTSTYDIQIYYKAGSASGSESNSGAWTLIGSATGISGVSGNPYKVTLTTQPVLNASQTYGFFLIRNGSGGSVRYHTATTPGAGNIWSQNSDMQFIVGNGASGVFTGVSNASRMFDGIFWYEAGGACVSNREPVALNVIDYTDVDSQDTQVDVCVGVDGDLYVNAKGSIDNYRWQKFDDNTQSYQDITAGTQYAINNNVLTVLNPPQSLDNSSYRLILDGVCGDDTSAAIKLTVFPLPAVSTPPTDQVHESGDIAIFEVDAIGPNLNYQWQVGNNDSFVNVNNGGVYSGVKTRQLTVSNVSFAQNGFQFRCIVSGSGNCVSVPDTSNFALLIVSPPASVSNINDNNDIKLYPNPATDQVVITTTDNSEYGGADYTITDKVGRIVSRGQLNETGNTTINISNLATDVYTIQIMNSEQKAAKTIRFTKL